MTTYIIRRLLIAIPVLLLITMIMYGILNLAPGEPTDMLIGQQALAPEEVEKIRVRLGLNQPVYVRYAKWLGQVVQGNLGYSFMDSQPVVNRLVERLGPSFTLMLFVVIVSYTVAVPIGVISAIRQYSWIDYLATALAFCGVSFPNFFSGLVGIYIFSLVLNWLPTGGLETIGQGFSFADRFYHLLLPGLVLAFREVGVLVALHPVQHAGCGPAGLHPHRQGRRAVRVEGDLRPRAPKRAAAPDNHAGFDYPPAVRRGGDH